MNEGPRFPLRIRTGVLLALLAAAWLVVAVAIALGWAVLHG